MVLVGYIFLESLEKSKQRQSLQDFFTYWVLDAALIGWMAEVGGIAGENGFDDCVSE